VVFGRFLFSGTLNTGLSYLFYLALLQFLTYRSAYTIAFVFGILISYGGFKSEVQRWSI
jgi:hypothetical protein